MTDVEVNPYTGKLDLVGGTTAASTYPIFTFNALTSKLTMETETGDSYAWTVEAIENFTLIGGAENFTLIGGENFTVVQ